MGHSIMQRKGEGTFLHVRCMCRLFLGDWLAAIIYNVFETNSCEIAHCGKSSISIFQEVLASYEKKFILAGSLGTSRFS